MPNWDKVNEAFNGLREAVKGQKFVTLRSGTIPKNGNWFSDKIMHQK